MTIAASAAADDPARQLLQLHRDRAERLLNAVRAVVILLLGVAALIYAPTLTPALNRVNVAVLAPALVWTVGQYLLFYRRQMLPSWLTVVNPLVDITAVTVIIGGYSFAESPSLGLKSPIFLTYLIILSARPIASSARRAGFVAALAVAEYAALLLVLSWTGRIDESASPLIASQTAALSWLDQGARLLLLAVAGAVATYATSWQERLATQYSLESRNREQLEVRLAQAQFQRLKLQLQPHFLFNTLNTITALISQDRAQAERMVSRLSELLRQSLRGDSDQEVPLEREMQIVRHYVEIQQARFADRLRVTFRIAPETQRALVPNFLLQPLIENAIRHGIAPRAAGGEITIESRREGDSLRLTISDDGLGAATQAEKGEGIGLANTRARLEHLYGLQQRMQISSSMSGFSVGIQVPFRLAGERQERSA